MKTYISLSGMEKSIFHLLTLRPRKTYIYVFQALFGFAIFSPLAVFFRS